MGKITPPLPNKVPEMLKLTDCEAIFVPGKYSWHKNGVGIRKAPYFLVQMRAGVPPRGSVTVESRNGWTYQQFVDAVKELLE